MEMMEEKKLRYFLILSHCLFLLTMPISLLFPISSTQQLLHFCYKPISVIHIWKAFNLYFLHYFVDIALFPKIFITFRWLNGNKTFLTVFSGQCLISRKPIISPIFKTSSGFKMAHFEDNINVMTVGTSDKCAVNMKIMTRTLQTEANGKFGKEKVKKKQLFFYKTFFLGNFLYF